MDLALAGIVEPWSVSAAGAVMRGRFVDDGLAVTAHLFCGGVDPIATACSFFCICNRMQCSWITEIAYIESIT